LLEALAVVAAVGAAVATAWLWDGARLRAVRRGGGLLLCALTALAAVGVGINREMRLFPGWADVFGQRTDVRTTPPRLVKVRHGRSEVVPWTFAGRQSGIRHPAYVYLPAAYLGREGRDLRFPVIEVLAGFPGGPRSWLDRLRLRKVIDREIRAGRMSPAVVVLPVQTRSPFRASECVDAVGGDRYDTYLSADLREALGASFRVRTDRDAWGVAGYSTGGFCAVNLTVRHPDQYAAAASLSGYFSPLSDASTGDLYRGDVAARHANDPVWRFSHAPAPNVALYLAAARDDGAAMREINRLTTVAGPPTQVTTALVSGGGHSFPAWGALAPAALDWVSAHLATSTPGP
jgi:enterochelin esterase-like enzyme